MDLDIPSNLQRIINFRLVFLEHALMLYLHSVFVLNMDSMGIVQAMVMPCSIHIGDTDRSSLNINRVCREL